jgi:hypothetical protein
MEIIYVGVNSFHKLDDPRTNGYIFSVTMPVGDTNRDPWDRYTYTEQE